MTIKEAINSIDTKLQQVLVGKAIEIAATSAIQNEVVRIFEQGLDCAGSPIGSYDTTTELWVADDKLPRAGTHKGKTGKNIKTSYFENYKALREQQQKESEFVNLRLTNDLQSDYANSSVSKSSNSVAKNVTPTKVNDLHYQVRLKRNENVEKVDGFSSVLRCISAKGAEIYKEVAEFELKKIFFNA